MRFCTVLQYSSSDNAIMYSFTLQLRDNAILYSTTVKLRDNAIFYSTPVQLRDNAILYSTTVQLKWQCDYEQYYSTAQRHCDFVWSYSTAQRQYDFARSYSTALKQCILCSILYRPTVRLKDRHSDFGQDSLVLVNNRNPQNLFTKHSFTVQYMYDIYYNLYSLKLSEILLKKVFPSVARIRITTIRIWIHL